MSPLNSGLFTAQSKFRMAPFLQGRRWKMVTPQSKLGFSLRAEEVVTQTNCTWTKCVWALSFLFFWSNCSLFDCVGNQRGNKQRAATNSLCFCFHAVFSSALKEIVYCYFKDLFKHFILFLFLFFIFRILPWHLPALVQRWTKPDVIIIIDFFVLFTFL